MDNFMDKLAQRLTAQEMIRANSAADAAELERLQKQLAEYDACLQEMRKLSLKNSETADRITEMVNSSLGKIQECEAKSADLTPVLEAIEKQCADMTELAAKSDEFVHKENVKVYRNVQAVVEEECKKLTEKLEENQKSVAESQKKVSGKCTAILVFMILTFLGVAADIAFQVLQYLQIL